ncbi:MAG TPA: DUF2339 domain-containing protein, partial [Tepidisphaeraceae bacterium]|nr:DUF2339 domain-containing protein [Tepidisphaeraceae bacterium]
MEAGLSRRLARLEERLEAVERHLGLSRDELTADARVEPQPFAEVAATEVGAEEEADVPPETVEVMPPPPLGTVPPTQVEPKPVAVVRGPPPLPGRRDNPPVEPLPAPALTPAAASPAAVLSYADRPKVRPVEQTTFERTVGLKWAGWVGAVVLVIGAGLGIKFAYDQGWFGGIPASVKLACLFAAGGALIAAGEYVYRRVNPLSAVGLFGAGVATLFLVSYAGQAYFNLYEPTSAFVLMAMATLVGAAVAMRGRLVSVAVLSLVGGNVAPFVLGGPGQIVPFLTYVLALQVVALVLAWWGREPKWWTLRGLSLATTSLWMTGAIVSGRAGSSVELMFASLYAALFHVELLLSARRGATTPAMTSSWTAFSTLVTALLAVAGAVVLWDDGAAPRTLWLATLAALTSAADFTLGRRDDRVRPLAVALRVQAAALLVAVAPAAVGGVALPVAWAVLAIAFAAVGTFTGSEVGRRFAVITWALAATHLLYWTGQHSGEQPVWLTVRGHGVPVAGGVAGLLALAGFAIARLIIARPAPGNDADGRAGARVVSGLATAVFVVAAIGSLPPLWATLALIAFAWALALAQPWAGGLDWAAAGAGVLAVAVAKWASVDTLVPRLSPGWAPGSGTPVLNGQTGVGALLAASVAGVARLRWADVQRSLRGSTAAAGWVVAAVAVLITFALSMEVDAAVARAVAGGAVLRWPAAQLEMLAFTTLWGVMLVAYRAAMHVVNRA